MKKTVFARVLALTLVLLTLCSGLTALADGGFTDDYRIGVPYESAVEAMVAKKVLEGFEDNTFRPLDTLKRDQAAKMAAVLTLGHTDAEALSGSSSAFADVPAGNWAAKYIAWCAENEILSGDENKNYNPGKELTGYQFAKILLCAFGYGKAEDYVNTGWDQLVAADGKAIGLFNGDDTMLTDKALTRQQAALMCANILKAGSQKDVDEQMVVDEINLTMLRNDGALMGIPRFYRNLDEAIGFEVKLGHEPAYEDGKILLKLRVSEYNSNRVICSYIFNGDVVEGKDTTTVTYNGSAAELMAYDEALSKDYFTDVNKYRVEVLLNSHVLGAFSFNVGFNTQAADNFARQLDGEGKFWISSISGQLVEQSERSYSERFIGMTRTLGAQFDISDDSGYEGLLPVTFKWSLDGDPLCQEVRVVDFDGEEMTLDTYIYNANSSTLDAGRYECVMYIFNTPVAECDCKLVD